MIKYFIGTSGWHYDDWRGLFYPEKLPKDRWLEFYARRFITLELNNSFYRLPSENAFTNWYNSSPEGFIFSVKASRYITHIKRLNDCSEAVNNFMSRACLLKEKLGPVLYQLPSNFHRDDTRLEAFLKILPKDIKHAIEFRHESWFHENIYDLLRKYNVGFAAFDMPDLTSILLATSDFLYLRFHGGNSLYSSRYSEREMSTWAEKISKLSGKLESAYIYFNNDVAGYAIENAQTLRSFLG